MRAGMLCIRRAFTPQSRRYMAGALLAMTACIVYWTNHESIFHGNVTCSVTRSWERGIESARFNPPADVLAANATGSPRLPGLLFSVWSGDLDHARVQWKCQIESHEAFADAQGVSYRLVRDRDEWAEERNREQLAPHWVKVQAIRHLLSEGHAWLFYVDTDTVFGLHKKGGGSLNSLMSSLDPMTSIVMDGSNSLGVGWFTDRVVLVNTDWTKYFMQQVWGLRLTCKDLWQLSEQAAFHVVLQEAIVHDLKVRVDRGEIGDSVSLHGHSTSGGTDLSSCCFVRELCSSPNMAVKRDTQGCTWAWQLSLGLTNDAFENKQMLYTIPRVTWEFRLSRLLGFGHPYKDQESCRSVLDGKSVVKNDIVFVSN